MVNFSIPKDTIEGRGVIPAGIYSLRCDGFKPSFSKDRGSINLNPRLKTVDFKTAEGEEAALFFNMNNKFGPGITDLVHGFGQVLVKNGDGSYTLPGKFDGDDADPTKWVYSGPLLGEVADVEVIVTTVMDGGVAVVDGDGNPKLRNEVKRFLCRVPNCKLRHMDDLTGKK